MFKEGRGKGSIIESNKIETIESDKKRIRKLQNRFEMKTKFIEFDKERKLTFQNELINENTNFKIGYKSKRSL